jgi:hypothetical protein
MKTRAATLILLLCVAMSQSSATNDMRGLAIFKLSEMCAAQDPIYREGIFGTWMEKAGSPRGGSWEKLDQSPLWQCLRKRQWVPKSICTTVNEVDPDDRVQLDQWFDAHASALDALDEVWDFMNASDDPKKASSIGCPVIEVIEKPVAESGFKVEHTDLIWAGEYEGSPNYEPGARLRKETDTIAASLGTRFGIKFNVVSQPLGGIMTIVYRLTVPEPGISVRASGERKRILDHLLQCVPGRGCMAGFSFEREDEIVPGIWKMEMFFRGKKLVEHEFTVEKANSNLY